MTNTEPIPCPSTTSGPTTRVLPPFARRAGAGPVIWRAYGGNVCATWVCNHRLRGVVRGAPLRCDLRESNVLVSGDEPALIDPEDACAETPLLDPMSHCDAFMSFWFPSPSRRPADQCRRGEPAHWKTLQAHLGFLDVGVAMRSWKVRPPMVPFTSLVSLAGPKGARMTGEERARVTSGKALFGCRFEGRACSARSPVSAAQVRLSARMANFERDAFAFTRAQGVFQLRYSASHDVGNVSPSNPTYHFGDV